MASHQVGMDVVRIAADNEFEGSGCVNATYRSVVFLIGKSGEELFGEVHLLLRHVFLSDTSRFRGFSTLLIGRSWPLEYSRFL